MITWRTELHFECDDGLSTDIPYNPDCHEELILDQIDAKTKKGMFGVAKRLGWTWDNQYCRCPSCAKIYIGIGRSLTAPPSHTTVRTGPYTAVRLIGAESEPGEQKSE